jgi:leader peptidase (prepilin peptidase)/N-methyltransferase
LADLPPTFDRSSLAVSGLFALLLGLASLPWLPLPAAAATAVLAFAMALITLSDLRHFRVPDVVSLPAIAVGVLANILVFHGGDWKAGLSESAIGAVLAGGSFFALRAAYYRFRGVEGLGLGDVKLAAVAGAWLGFEPLPMLVLAAAIAALAAVLLRAIIRPGLRIDGALPIPFGSFLAPAILFFWLWRLAGFSLV